MSIHLVGLEGLTAKITRLEQLTAVKAAIRSIAIYIKGEIAKYAPATMANSSAEPHWYERGYGSRWHGGTGGRQTSKTLGRSWTIESRNSGYGAVVGNNATYGPYVQDADRQTIWAGVYGWETVQDVSDEETDYVNRVLTEVVQEEIDRK